MDTPALRQKLLALGNALDERSRRLVFAAEAQSLGRGGIERVHLATGVARSTLARGVKELARPTPHDTTRIRRPGGGRMRLTKKDPSLLADLETLVEPSSTRPTSCPSSGGPARASGLLAGTRAQGHTVSYPVVAELLAEAGYAFRGTGSGGKPVHPDRNAQFEHINALVRQQQRVSQPVISVDTKKKELIGDFKNGGKAWRPKGCPRR